MATTRQLTGLAAARRVIFPMAAIMLLVGAVLVGIILYSARTMDRNIVTSQTELIDNSINARLTRSLSELRSVAWWDEAHPADGSRCEARRMRRSMSGSRAMSPPTPAPLDVSRRSLTSLPVLRQGQIAIRFRLRSERNGTTRIARSTLAGENTSRSAGPIATVLSDSTSETLNDSCG